MLSPKDRLPRLRPQPRAQQVFSRYPEGVAADSRSVYVADRRNSGVVKLAAGSKTQTVLPITGLKNPGRVAGHLSAARKVQTGACQI